MIFLVTKKIFRTKVIIQFFSPCCSTSGIDHLIELRVRTIPSFLVTILLKSLSHIVDYETIQISELCFVPWHHPSKPCYLFIAILIPYFHRIFLFVVFWSKKSRRESLCHLASGSIQRSKLFF